MKKISMRQALMLVVAMVFSPSVRLFSSFVSGKGNQASWLAPLFSGIFMLLYIFVLNQLIKTDRNFYQLLEYSFGGILGKIICTVYIIWGIGLTALQMRYYAGRVAGTIYTEIGMDIFLLVLIGICLYALKNGINVLARINEILLPVIIAVASLILAFLTQDIHFKALIPIENAGSIAHVSLFTLASFGYLTLVLFFTDEINERESFKKYAMLGLAFTTLFVIWLFVTVIGALGPHIIEKLPYPFFSVVKQISLGEFLQHIEAFVITLWILSDFVLISFILRATVKLFGGLTRSADTKEFLLPFIVLCALLVDKTGRTNHELEVLSEKLFVPLNLILLFIVPLIMLLCVKLKGKILQKRNVL